MNFKKLLAILINYHHNFRILHWNITGTHFDKYHDLCTEYYTKIQVHIDLIAEIGITYNSKPISLLESYEILKDSSEDYKLLRSNSDYSELDVINNIDVMFKDIMNSIKALLDSSEVEKNPGVRSELENMYSYYDIECNYKNKRRKK